MEIVMVIGLYVCLLVLLGIAYIIYTSTKKVTHLLAKANEEETLQTKMLSQKLDTTLQTLTHIHDHLRTQTEKLDSAHQQLMDKVNALQQATEKVDRTLHETLTLE
jgi:hypothetical protein